jgi:hypothetical protein
MAEGDRKFACWYQALRGVSSEISILFRRWVFAFCRGCSLTSLPINLKISACNGGVAVLPLRLLSQMKSPSLQLLRLAEPRNASGGKVR